MTLDLPAIRARAEAATPGPWQEVLCPKSAFDGKDWIGVASEDVVGKGGLGVCINGRVGDGHEVQSVADAEFIAHARTDIPALLAEVDRLREQVKRAAYWVVDEIDPDMDAEGKDALVAEALEATHG
jgi:hypothetical protein